MSLVSTELNKDDFSKEVCRSMIAMMDVDRSGKLNFEEFQILWAAIRYWKVCESIQQFSHHDRK
jgi:Ca2+-binding EF-hand superfamily protein